MELIADDSQVDVVCVVLTSITGPEAVRVASEIAAVAGSGRPPLLVCWLVARSLAAEGMALLAHGGSGCSPSQPVWPHRPAIS